MEYTVDGKGKVCRYQISDVFKTNGVRLLCTYVDLARSSKDSSRHGDVHDLYCTKEHLDGFIGLDMGEVFTCGAFYMPNFSSKYAFLQNPQCFWV